MQPTNILRPIIPNNASSLRITATAGTKLVRAFSLTTVIILVSKRILQPIHLLLHKQIFFAFLIHAISLDQAFAHSPIFLTAGLKPGPCLSSNVADHPLRSTKDHRLCRLLSNKLPNPSQAHLKAVLNFSIFGIFTAKHSFLKYDYPKLLSRFLCITHPFAMF